MSKLAIAFAIAVVVALAGCAAQGPKVKYDAPYERFDPTKPFPMSAEF